MTIDLERSIAIIRDVGALGLLLILIVYGLPRVFDLFNRMGKALDRNTRMLYHMAVKIGVEPETGSDILREMEVKK